MNSEWQVKGKLSHVVQNNSHMPFVRNVTLNLYIIYFSLLSLLQHLKQKRNDYLIKFCLPRNVNTVVTL